MSRLKELDFNNPEIKNCLEYIDRTIVGEFIIKDNLTYDIEKFQSLYSKENIKKHLDESLNKDIEKLITKSNYYISNLVKLSNNCKVLQEEQTEIIFSLTQKDSNINEMLDFYSDYLRNNKNFLIRNEILKTFIEKISITKEEKDNLVDKSNFDERFFNLIDKLVNIKANIQLIEKSKQIIIIIT